MNWYAVKTQNNKEKSVVEKLNAEVSRSGLQSLLGRCLIPTEKVISKKNGKTFSREKTIFSGYVFVETSAVEEIASLLRNVNGASGFVRTKSKNIVPLKESEVARILKLEDEKIESNKPIEFSIGDEIKIVSGPFDTFKGKVEEVLGEKHKVKVGVLIFGRTNSIELDFTQIERVY